MFYCTFKNSNITKLLLLILQALVPHSGNINVWHIYPTYRSLIHLLAYIYLTYSKGFKPDSNMWIKFQLTCIDTIQPKSEGCIRESTTGFLDYNNLLFIQRTAYWCSYHNLNFLHLSIDGGCYLKSHTFIMKLYIYISDIDKFVFNEQQILEVSSTLTTPKWEIQSPS